MTTSRSRAIDVLVVDMSTVTFRWNADHTACAAYTARGELVALVDAAADTDVREVAFQLLDAALDRGQVLRTHPDDPSQRLSYRVALYNPFSGEVSVGSIPDTVSFSDRNPLPLPAEGLEAVAVLGGRNQQLQVRGGRVLGVRELTLAGLTRLQVAHAA